MKEPAERLAKLLELRSFRLKRATITLHRQQQECTRLESQAREMAEEGKQGWQMFLQEEDRQLAAGEIQGIGFHDLKEMEVRAAGARSRLLQLQAEETKLWGRHREAQDKQKAAEREYQDKNRKFEAMSLLLEQKDRIAQTRSELLAEEATSEN